MTKQNIPLTGEALIKEVCRRIRVARSYNWDTRDTGYSSERSQWQN